MTRSVKTILAICLLSITSSSVYAETTKVVVIPMAGDDIAGVEKTGQTLCYDSNHAVIDCTGTSGQDGETQIGTAWPNPRFSDNSDGTVTDNLTDLVWLKDANCFDQVLWSTALSDADSLANGDCSLSDSSSAGDWRLPNRKELLSLIDLDFFDPALSDATGTNKWTGDNVFTDVQSFYYWSSSTFVEYASDAWIVDLDGGEVSGYDKTETSYVWPVKAGQ
ncbi:MAG: DUF1566 domain-containing protein [Desulfobacterales bacterium]|nr:DUF1566 domain-containing protein [Desulfobacterales bacterium]